MHVHRTIAEARVRLREVMTSMSGDPSDPVEIEHVSAELCDCGNHVCFAIWFDAHAELFGSNAGFAMLATLPEPIDAREFDLISWQYIDALLHSEHHGALH